MWCGPTKNLRGCLKIQAREGEHARPGRGGWERDVDVAREHNAWASTASTQRPGCFAWVRLCQAARVSRPDLLMEELLGLPPVASAQGQHVDKLIIYLHWLMIALFVVWLA